MILRSLALGTYTHACFSQATALQKNLHSDLSGNKVPFRTKFGTVDHCLWIVDVLELAPMWYALDSKSHESLKKKNSLNH